MKEIKLVLVSQLGNRIKSGQIIQDMILDFKKENHTELKIGVTVNINLDNKSYAEHKSLSVWNNIDFNITPEILSSPSFDILVDLVQTSLGHERILFINENLDYMDSNVPFCTNNDIKKLLKTLILTSYN